MTDRDFYSVKQFAEKIGKSPRTVLRAIYSNRILPIRIGQGKNASYRIPHSELGRIAVVDLDKIINDLAEKKSKEK